MTSKMQGMHADETSAKFEDANAETSPRDTRIANALDEEPIQREQIFGILSNERRRLVLQYLRDNRENGRVGFRDLVDQVAAWENDTTADRVDSSDRKCVYTALRQTHLPKLDKLGVVEFDHRRGYVELTESADDVLLYMRYAPEREIFWSRLYLLLALLGGFCALLIYGGTPFGGVPELAMTIVIAAAFGAASIAQMYHSRRHEVGIDGPTWS